QDSSSFSVSILCQCHLSAKSKEALHLERPQVDKDKSSSAHPSFFSSLVLAAFCLLRPVI
ncbi:MAG TPA: hypothetical protein VGA09_11660, partial [Candidatus Binatia bacterium]